MFNLAEIELTLGKVAIGFLTVIIFGAGCYWYGKHVQKQTDSNLGLHQQVIKGQIEGAQNDTTMQVAEVYSEYIDILTSKLEWMRKHPTLVKAPVSGPAISSGSTNGTEPEFGRTCTRTFYENGLKDALTLTAWQKWAKEQKIPVK